MQSRSTRSIALFTGSVIAASLFASAAPAHAQQSKTYKTGAIVLGAAAAIFAAKGKNLPAVIAGAGAYYAYKKSQDAQNGNYSDNGNSYPGDEYAYGGIPGNDQPYYGDYGNTNDVPPYYDNGGVYTNDDAPYYGNDGYYADSGNIPDYGNDTRTTRRSERRARRTENREQFPVFQLK